MENLGFDKKAQGVRNAIIIGAVVVAVLIEIVLRFLPYSIIPIFLRIVLSYFRYFAISIICVVFGFESGLILCIVYVAFYLFGLLRFGIDPLSFVDFIFYTIFLFLYGLVISAWSEKNKFLKNITIKKLVIFNIIQLVSFVGMRLLPRLLPQLLLRQLFPNLAYYLVNRYGYYGLLERYDYYYSLGVSKDYLANNAILPGIVIAILDTLIVYFFYKQLTEIIEKTKQPETSLPENIDEAKKSYFDGGLLSLLGWKILGFFITLFTLGICYPWALCMVYGWKVNHTTINGKRLKFNGKAIALFGYWILWGFLTIITLGIYSFWLSISLKKWIVKNTSIVETDGTEKPLSTNTDSAKSYFDGGLLSLIGWKILGFFTTLFSFGICYPWALCMVYGWEINHSVIEGKRQKFNGKAISLFGYWILWGFLTIITIGIYSLWLGIALEKWKVKNTTFEETTENKNPVES